MIVIFIVSAAFSAYAEEELPPDFDGLPKPGEKQVTFTVQVQPEPPFYPGEALRVRITADIRPGWKLYSLIDQGEKAPPPTAFSFGDTSLQPAKAVYETEPVREFVEVFQIDLYSHKRRAFFYQNFQIPPDHPAGNFSVPFTVSYVVCSFRICMPPADEEMVFSYTVSAGSPRPERTEQNFNTDAQPADVMKADYKSDGFLSFALLAVLTALLSLTAPCIFPMVPVTVSFFSHKAGKRRGKTLQYAVLFAGGIIGSYMLLGLIISFLFGAEAVTQLAANPYVNLLLGAVFVLFAFSLIGWVNIAVPAGLLSRFDRFAAGRGEVLGTVLMGAVFTLTAFTCSVQFMGVLIVAAYRGDFLWPLFGMLIFAVVFAAPFFLLALLPGFFGRFKNIAGGALPRLKTVLGILEIGIAVKFISNADLVWGAGLISRDTNLIIWVLLLAVAAGYLLLSDPHRRTFRISGARISAVFLLAPLVFVSFGLNDRSVGAIADSLLPPPVGGVLRKGSDYVPEAEFKELVWHPSYGKALEAAKASGRPVFIDFTGYTCINCRWMEQNIFARKEVFKVLQERYVIAKLYTDGGEYEAENRRLQTEKFDTVALPFYALTDADGNILKTAAGVMDEAAFLEFIR